MRRYETLRRSVKVSEHYLRPLDHWRRASPDRGSDPICRGRRLSRPKAPAGPPSASSTRGLDGDLYFDSARWFAIRSARFHPLTTVAVSHKKSEGRLLKHLAFTLVVAVAMWGASASAQTPPPPATPPPA